MKKKFIIGLLLVAVISVVSFKLFQNSTSNINEDVLTDLEGTIYFTKRVDGVLTLFKSDASLQNKTLVYSHKGKGNDGLGNYNDNIINFYYYKAEETVYFIAMDNEFVLLK
ncbi:hypothetical protein [Bacillus sp. RO1]|uniref:hypothetical protein n=1 Tax=Bacillus sp. RO1 TaxID=2722703 RepID=UPI001F0D15F4|nr:hypothetical protein [Bacillus sp. RO1]